jgi:hypothetical protein
VAILNELLLENMHRGRKLIHWIVILKPKISLTRILQLHARLRCHPKAMVILLALHNIIIGKQYMGCNSVRKASN